MHDPAALVFAPSLRPLARVVPLLALGVLAGCAGLNAKEPPPCPPVYILGDTQHVTKYRLGAGRDLTDVELEAEVVGFKGECHYDGKGAIVDLGVSFDVKRGPAASGREAELTYFVAIPKFYPADSAKAVVTAPIRFPDGVESARINDEGVTLRIPVKNREVIDQYEIYIGFQLTPEQLDQNRKQRQ